MGLGMSKRYSYSFQPISAKLYEDIAFHGGIQKFIFHGNQPSFNLGALTLSLALARGNQHTSSLMENGNVVEATSLQSATYLWIWQITRRSNGLHFPGLHAFPKVGRNWMNIVVAVAFSWHQEFFKVHRITPNWTQRIRQNVSYICTYKTTSPKFWTVSLYDQPFSRYGTFLRFSHWPTC